MRGHNRLSICVQEWKRRSFSSREGRYRSRSELDTDSPLRVSFVLLAAYELTASLQRRERDDWPRKLEH